MEWKIIRIGQTQSPMVTVEPGKITFNAPACALIRDDGAYRYAQFFSARDNWKPVFGVRFLTEELDNSLPITRPSGSGEPAPEMIIFDSGLISARLLKDNPIEQDQSVSFAVKKVDDTMLMIAD